jgi:hypothetical protein
MQKENSAAGSSRRTVTRPVAKLDLLFEFSILGEKGTEEFETANSLHDLGAVFARRGAGSVANFIEAVERCDAGDVYDASQLFFSCISIGDSWFDLASGADQSGQRVLIRERDVLTTSNEGWLTSGASLVERRCASVENGEQRNAQTAISPVTEALALAVARAACIRGDYSGAHALIHRLLLLSRKSIHLRAVEYAVGLLLKGDTVPDYLKKFVGYEVNALADRFCPVPFARADVHQSGEVVMCCSHWLPTPIGNVFNGTAEGILNSDTAKSIRKSVVDGSFKYCSHTDCEPLLNSKLPFKKDYVDKDFDDEYYHIDRQILSDAFALKRFEIPNVSYLVFCLDRTCNLTCPSCRTDLIMVKGAERDQLYSVTESVVLPMLKNAKRVMVNPSGEAFVSRPSRRLMQSLAEPGYENLAIDIITNGTVCDRREWDKFAHLYGRTHIVRVSIDGVSKRVIEKLRRGVDYDVLMANLQNLKRMHNAGQDGAFRHFFISFTYQRDNLFEMEDFVEFGWSLNASTVIFERLQNVGAFTPEEYYERAVHLVDHPLHRDFLRIAAKVKRDPKVYIDFNPPAQQEAASEPATAPA